MNRIEFIEISRNIIRAFIDTPYRDDLSEGIRGYSDIPDQYKFSGDTDEFKRVITQGNTIYGENLHGHIFLTQRNGKYEYNADFSTIHNCIRYIITYYNDSIQVFRDNFPIPTYRMGDYYLYSGYLHHKEDNFTVLSQDSNEYHELLNIFAATIMRFAQNRGLFRNITPEKLNAVQKIVDSDCFILLHSGPENIANAKIKKGFWNNSTELKEVMTYDLRCSQPNKVKDKKGNAEPLTTEEILNYTYHPKEHPSTIVFAIPNAIFTGYHKKEVYEAIIDFKEYDPLVEKESEDAKEFWYRISTMPDGEEKQKKQKEFLIYYSKFNCAFVPKDLIAGILNAQGEFQQNPEWIVLQPNRDELISIHRQRMLANIKEKEEKGLECYSELAKTRIIERQKF